MTGSISGTNGDVFRIQYFKSSANVTTGSRFAQADCFFLPYKEVGQSGSAALGDALAALKPVITSKATTMFAYRSQVDTVYSSVAVDAKKHAAVAALIQHCVNETGQDSQLARTHQQRVGDRCSLAMTAARYRQVYEFARQSGQKQR